jgi:hypothetical protein
MEAVVPLGTRNLPPEYQAVVAAGYDEEALLQQVLEVSKKDEDKIFPSYNDEYMASLPPP